MRDRPEIPKRSVAVIADSATLLLTDCSIAGFRFGAASRSFANRLVSPHGYRNDIGNNFVPRHRPGKSAPAIYQNAAFVREGGLLSYGPDIGDSFLRAASYLDRILSGIKPGPSRSGADQIRYCLKRQNCQNARFDVSNRAAHHRRRGDRIGAPAASWRDPAGGSPVQVRRCGRLVASVGASRLTAVPAGVGPANRGIQSLL
jgi:hypothetical protein